MDTILNILASLGVNSTIWIQLAIFVVTFIVLKEVVFKPYFAKFEIRQERTKGGIEKSAELIEQTKELETKYQSTMRLLNTEIKEIFDTSRAEANKEQEKIIIEARAASKITQDNFRIKLQNEVNKAREELIKQTPTIGQSISDSLLPREVQ